MHDSDPAREETEQRRSRFQWTAQDIVIIRDGKEVPLTQLGPDSQPAPDALPGTSSAAEPKPPNKDHRQED